ncbi:MAG: sensor hybrid histidine kinase [Bacteroidota bacterium]|nr:sensor hybrid histidine kinase [Bacteroidota bacterium]
MKFSFEQKLSLLFVVIFAGIVTIGVIMLKNNNAFNNTNYLVKHTQQVLAESEKVYMYLQEIESSERGYVITGDTSYLTRFYSVLPQVATRLKTLKALTADNREQQTRTDSLTSFAEKKIAFTRQTVELVSAGNKEALAGQIPAKTGKKLMDQVRQQVDNIEAEENGLLAIRKTANEKSISALNRLTAALFAVLFLISAVAFFIIRYTLQKRKKLEDENKQTSTFLNTILENIPNMIFVKDARSLKFVRFNKAGEKLLGQPRENLIGKNDYDFFPKEEADFFTAKDNEVLNNGALIDIPEEPILTKNGERWLHTKKIPIVDETGSPIYLLGISEDITEERKHSEEVKQLNTELRKTVSQLLIANKEMEAFTYSVSHDLRAPLRIIDGFGEILIKDLGPKLNDEGTHNLRVIVQNAKHMGQLIDDLLNLSRLGRTQLTVKQVDMKSLVDDVIAALKIIDHKNAKAQISIELLNPAVCDLSLIRQVWINLISNALKYSRNKEEPVIHIGCDTVNGKTVYYIKDNGVGFDMQYSHKLFGVFQRLHKISEFEGTGVGLALVNRIVTKHNGRVWADAKMDEGATFYFTLNE